MKRVFLILPVVLMFLLISSCKKGETTAPDSGSQDFGNGNGLLKVNLVDNPAHVMLLMLQISRVEAHKASDTTGKDSWIVVNDTPQMINILSLRNGISSLIGTKTLPAGHYTQIRLYLGNGGYVIDDDGQKPIIVSSAYQSGIKLNHEFDITEGQVYELTLDFNAAKSLTLSGAATYRIRPVFRLFTNQNTGTISGSVLPWQAGPRITTVAGTDTITTFSDSLGNFKLLGMPPGTYTLNLIPASTLHKDTTINSVKVQSGRDTNVGAFTLNHK